MTDKQRNELREINELIDDAISRIEEVENEMEEALANLPEAMFDSERADLMRSSLHAVHDAVGYMADAYKQLENAIEYEN